MRPEGHRQIVPIERIEQRQATQAGHAGNVRDDPFILLMRFADEGDADDMDTARAAPLC